MQKTYLLTLGEFEYYQLEADEQFLWLFFIVATVFNLIVMLNLLVAVIGETFVKVDSQRIEYSYKEKVVTMSTLQRLLGKCIQRGKGEQ